MNRLQQNENPDEPLDKFNNPFHKEQHPLFNNPFHKPLPLFNNPFHQYFQDLEKSKKSRLRKWRLNYFCILNI
jgi:hypothetical protein